MEAIILALVAQVPSLISTINQLIARGRESGELSPERADALTALAQSLFGKFSTPAPPPPGA